MGNDLFSITTSRGWFSRIGGSFKGMIVAIVLMIVSAGVLWWNEGRSVKTAKGLAEGAQVAVEAGEGVVEPAKDGKLVHVVGKTTVREAARDDVFGVTGADLVKLRRRVEIFQWDEETTRTTRRRTGGSEETTTEYRYNKKWDERTHDSSHFHQRTGHENPPPSITKAEFNAPDARLGAFRLPSFLLAQWTSYSPYTLPDARTLPKELGDRASVQDGWLLLSATPADPAVGDVRVRFESIKAGDASVLARQVKDSFEPYVTSYGTDIARIESGIKSKDEMFAEAQAANTFLAWVLRVVGFVLMFIGFSTLLKPLKVLADVLPIAGSIVGVGTGFVALLLSAIGSSVIIAVAWVWYRPVLGISLLLVAGAGIFILVRALRKRTA